MTGTHQQPDSGPRRYGRDTLEFGRVVNLGDGLFAIALTLLVFTLDASDAWTREWFDDHGLHRLRGTVRHPKAA